MVSSNVYPQRDRPVCLETERQTSVSGNREKTSVSGKREDQCVWRAKSRWREERVRDLGWPSAAMWQCWGGSEASEGATRRF